ncbi:MAG TPA: TIGR02453 family protein [bacterium]|nr:TIGR02453 family protein [bacterium]
MPKTILDRRFFQFLVELRFNNERPWFQARKERYQAEVQAPFLKLVETLTPKLQAVNPAYTEPKAFRIYRDTRFSHDKSPYKSHVAAQWRHRAALGDVHAPGFYLHLEPGECYAGGGLWSPDADALAAVRKRIARRDPQWLAIQKQGMPLWDQDSLKRPPKGWRDDHPMIQDLKRRHFITWVDLRDQAVCGPQAVKKIIQAFERSNPLIVFLNQCLHLR